MAGKFEPKTPVQLNPPRNDLISLETLAAAKGKYILLSMKYKNKIE